MKSTGLQTPGVIVSSGCLHALLAQLSKLQKLVFPLLAIVLGGLLFQSSVQASERSVTPACLVQYDGICSHDIVPPIPQTREFVLKVSASGNTARDGNIAIREEFDAALLANSFAAWELFIRRHPDHPLVEAAWGELRKLGCECDKN